MDDSLTSGLILRPYSDSLLEITAQHVLKTYRAQLPDLSKVIILLPDMQQAPLLREHLLQLAEQEGFNALVGPSITTLKNWSKDFIDQAQQTLLCDYERELILVEAVREHLAVFGGGNPWQVAEALLPLFDELTQQNFKLPDDLDIFIDRITQAYGSSGDDYQHLTREAKLVFTLWHAWHQQLEASNSLDANTAYLISLQASLGQLSNDVHLYLVGQRPNLPAEQQWLSELIKRDQLTWITAGQLEADQQPHLTPETALSKLIHDLPIPRQQQEETAPAGLFFNALFSEQQQSLLERAKHFSSKHPSSPIKQHLAIFHAHGAEEEARAIELQVRIWLLAGKKRIGIVTENRKQARRVRALLERASVQATDRAGWALSTTSAATVLERWLQCIEEDFAHQPLLDLLKSPFIFPEKDREAQLALTYRFERDIVFYENIGQGLERYQQQIPRRQQRLPENLHADLDAIGELLSQLEQAAEKLLALYQGEETHPAQFLTALQESLCALGLDQSLQDDEAGLRVLQELEQMLAATSSASFNISWNEFRAWLGRSLERYNFQAENHNNHVELLSLQQSRGDYFDAVIIASAEQEFLPGSQQESPFFNRGVRNELGLPTQLDEYGEQFYLFRRLLQSSPDILFTLRAEQDGEEIIPSPWLELLKTFHELAYDDDLAEKELHYLLAEKESAVDNSDHSPLPDTIEQNPTVSIDPSLLPKSLSASSYQQLINCPYQFFVARCLGLSATDEMKETLAKSDYGERVHLCLEAFHQQVKNLPKPYPKAITKNNREDAIEHLTTLSKKVFAQDLEDNFQHRGWLTQWLSLIPRYIDWQIEHQQQWNFDIAETQGENQLSEQVLLKGRLDRIDKNSEGIAIIDYKTSSKLPSNKEIMDGEAVQLPLYALLCGEANNKRVSYLQLDKKELSEKSVLIGDELLALAEQTAARLTTIIGELKEGVPSPAWGDETTCGFCDMSGICRKQAWEKAE